MSPLFTNIPTLGTCLRLLGIAILGILLVWYVHFQARSFIEGPSIALNDTGDILHHERTIVLTGTTKNIVGMTLNGREIHTNENGDFSERLILEDGYTIMTLYAEDRFGRSTTLTREFVYSPETPQTDGV